MQRYEAENYEIAAVVSTDFQLFFKYSRRSHGRTCILQHQGFFLQIFLALVCVVRDYFGHVT